MFKRILADYRELFKFENPLMKVRIGKYLFTVLAIALIGTFLLSPDEILLGDPFIILSVFWAQLRLAFFTSMLLFPTFRKRETSPEEIRRESIPNCIGLSGVSMGSGESANSEDFSSMSADSDSSEDSEDFSSMSTDSDSSEASEDWISSESSDESLSSVGSVGFDELRMRNQRFQEQLQQALRKPQDKQDERIDYNPLGNTCRDRLNQLLGD